LWRCVVALRCGAALCRGGVRVRVVARCDREVRCETGAAPATVSGEPAATATALTKWEWEGAAGDDPEPGDLRIAPCDGIVRVGPYGTIPRAEEEPLSSLHAGRAGPGRTLPRLTLVLGGARSGKSGYAERLVEAAAAWGTYIATAEPLDAEMAARIAAHRTRRGRFWHTVEAPMFLTDAIVAETRSERPVLVDCLTLWLSNLIMAEARLDEAFATLRAVLRDATGPIVLVANEVGLGLVPETPLGRDFRDAAGWLNQDIAALADRVVFVAAGLPLVLKEG
jgi:adenosylcobinamide kinase/adenosylcobinamide-phosphate guanylyltransferase